MNATDNVVSRLRNHYPKALAITMLTFVAVVVIILEHTIPVNLVGLLIIIEVAAQMEYGGNNGKGKQMKRITNATDNVVSLSSPNTNRLPFYPRL